MTNYVERFIPNYSTVTEPLRRLTKQGVQWEWIIELQQSFDKLKNELVADRIMGSIHLSGLVLYFKIVLL
jgi:hypothetical protein